MIINLIEKSAQSLISLFIISIGIIYINGGDKLEIKKTILGQEKITLLKKLPFWIGEYIIESFTVDLFLILILILSVTLFILIKSYTKVGIIQIFVGFISGIGLLINKEILSKINQTIAIGVIGDKVNGTTSTMSDFTVKVNESLQTKADDIITLTENVGVLDSRVTQKAVDSLKSGTIEQNLNMEAFQGTSIRMFASICKKIGISMPKVNPGLLQNNINSVNIENNISNVELKEIWTAYRWML